MAFTRRNNLTLDQWANRAWTADTTADLPNIPAKHGDMAYVTADSEWYLWGDTGDWLNLSAGGGGGGDVSDGDTLSTGLTFPNTGLHLLDPNASHDLILAPGSDLSADRTLTLTTGDANRTLTLTADASVAGTNTGDVSLGGSLDYITISGQTITRNAIDLAADITGVLDETNGGTGQSTITTGDLLYGSGANTLSKRGIGSSNDVLIVSGGVPTWSDDLSLVTLAVSTSVDINGPTTIDINGAGAALTITQNDTNANTTFSLRHVDSGTASTDGFDFVLERDFGSGTNGTVYLIQRENESMIFRTNNTNRLQIEGGGRVNLLSGQLQFPASQNASSDANTLDDYEEGTWTPTLTTSSVDFSSVTYDFRAATYTKIGRVVTAYCEMRTSAVTIGFASGNVAIGGFPFAFPAGFVYPGVVGGFPGGAWGSGKYPNGLYGQPSTSYAVLTLGNSLLDPTLDVATGAASNYIHFTLTYMVS